MQAIVFPPAAVRGADLENLNARMTPSSSALIKATGLKNES
jgi:hypothetical protein